MGLFRDTLDGAVFLEVGTSFTALHKRFSKEKIQTGNKAYYANLQMFKSKIISIRSKLQIYKTLIRPILTYWAETWTLTAAEENALRRFERKVLRYMDQWWIRGYGE